MVGAEGKDVAHIGLTLVTRSPRLKSLSVLQHSQHDPLQDHLTRRGHTASPNGSRDAAQRVPLLILGLSSLLPLP